VSFPSIRWLNDYAGGEGAILVNDSNEWAPYAYTILDSRVYALCKNAGHAVAGDTNVVAVFGSRQYPVSSSEDGFIHHLDSDVSGTLSLPATVTAGSVYTCRINAAAYVGDVIYQSPNYYFVSAVSHNVISSTTDVTVYGTTAPSAAAATLYHGYTTTLKFFPWNLGQHGEYKHWRTLTLAWNPYVGSFSTGRRLYVRVDYDSHNGSTSTGSYVNCGSLPLSTFFVPASQARLPRIGPSINVFPWSIWSLSGIEVSYVLPNKGKVGWRR
jgi:hypothetical protein